MTHQRYPGNAGEIQKERKTCDRRNAADGEHPQAEPLNRRGQKPVRLPRDAVPNWSKDEQPTDGIANQANKTKMYEISREITARQTKAAE
ncbi:hypothetical protein HKX23_14160 [Sulfitobacter sp. KE29]|jgi:hypothetical protein|uniref:hypothetical protein n=1 Tax=Sulfitobacter TaxID=60136 RepID=UPI001428B83B|nr:MULTISPECIES: hypothetical protein [Sulfitobacter]MDF3419513.1 hypothetical protein [Sulfitobacter sp. Ks38]MDF3426995.1 hypothetical protein [Sulfitobacter sp. KE29]MDF3430577.1 hypothetical protein [Sulfitobacter sp. S46]MDF3445349.1 hypothetical protein [Sulfitobacter sp. KE31]MDF3549374.1 hypothetical protein [Sulfitobacter sp. KE28]